MSVSIKSILFSVALVGGIAATSAASAQDFSNPYAYGGGTDFEGLYVGITAGYMGDSNSNHLNGGSTSAMSAGGVAGVNLQVTDQVLAGMEVQGTVNFASSNSFDALALGRVGMTPTSDLMLYGAAGGGVANGDGVYALGGGAEFAVNDMMGVRGEVLGLGTFGSAPDAMKVTAGAILHLD